MARIACRNGETSNHTHTHATVAQVRACQSKLAPPVFLAPAALPRREFTVADAQRFVQRRWEI